MLPPNRRTPEKVRDFLQARRGRSYCDECIQIRMGLRWRQQVQLITATLSVTRSFERSQDICCYCNERKHVICALVPPSSNSNLSE
jgi:hypothetical protein